VSPLEGGVLRVDDQECSVRPVLKCGHALPLLPDTATARPYHPIGRGQGQAPCGTCHPVTTLVQSIFLGLVCVLPAPAGDSTTRTDARYQEVMG
jgi:hypothetical protein